MGSGEAHRQFVALEQHLWKNEETVAGTKGLV